MWLYRTSEYNRRKVKTDASIVLYDYQPYRKTKRPEDFLKGWSGYLHADGYEAYHKLERETGVTVVGCWAHVRRKFDEALKGTAEKDRETSGAFIGKRYCDQLFAIESELKALSPESRHMERQKQTKPVLDEFFCMA